MDSYNPILNQYLTNRHPPAQGITHYNPKLKDIIKGTNNNNSVVLNRNFSRWEKDIAYNVKERSGDYSNKEAKKLLEITKKHIKKNSSPLKSNNVLFLTHPLYLHLTHYYKLNSITKPQAKKYLNDFVGLLKKRVPKNKLNIIVLETLHHYGAATSLLLEQGLISDVILTKYDTGTPLNGSLDLEKYKENQIFVGGGYNEMCLQASLTEMHDTGLNIKKMRFIKELIINHPGDDSLKPKRIYIKRDWIKNCSISSNDKRVITIKEMLKIIEQDNNPTTSSNNENSTPTPNNHPSIMQKTKLLFNRIRENIASM